MSTATIDRTGTWTVDAAHSRVGFAVKHLGIASVHGTFNDFEGTLVLSDDLASARAYGTVKAASVDTGDAGRDEHLRSADFFDADANPDLTFASTSIESTGPGELRITGDLTLNGITNTIVLDAEITGTETDPWGNERVGLEIGGQLSRGEYGMKFNQALGSGNALVSDKVKISLDISAVKASAS